MSEWQELLGRAFFDLPRYAGDLKYSPSYRSLISYVIRTGPDAYLDPFRHFRNQKTWDSQLHVAYLLGMNWEYAARWQEVKDKEAAVTAIENAMKIGALEGTARSIGELETSCIQLEYRNDQAQQALKTFKVHPQYESLQRDANDLTEEIHGLVNLNVTERRRLARYMESVEMEAESFSVSVDKLYRDAGVIFPEQVKRTLNECRSFHEQVIANRKHFLEAEILKMRNKISDRENRLKLLTDKRATVMGLLETHGALDEMSKLQEQQTTLQSELEQAKQQLSEMKGLKNRKRDLKAAKTNLAQTAEQDHEQRREIWSEAVRLFNEHSQALYNSPGKFIIDIDETGYKYTVSIERSGSEGIDKMKIFCFDLAVLQLQSGLDFLVHDTLMYDSVDERQRARAYELAHKITMQMGGQYICTVNSDMVPYDEFSSEFDFDQYVRLRLSDSKPSESLLGISFGRP